MTSSRQPEQPFDPAAGSDDPLSKEGATELHRKTLLLLLVFLIIHFSMLTARAAVIDLQHQAEIIRARLYLVPLGGLMCYLVSASLRRIAKAGFLRQILLGALLSALAALVHAYIWAVFLQTLDGANYPSPASYVAYQSFYWYLFYFAWTTAYLALSYSITVREQERQAASFLAAAKDAQLRALRYQVNPHFLFNTLNAVAELVGEDADKAEEMVLNLSEFYRGTLALEPTEDIPLRQELALQLLYLKVEKVRFPDRLLVEVEVPGELEDALVPSLILQPLIENALKYGVARSRERTTVVIRAESPDGRLQLEVRDDAVASGAAPGKGTGVGLQNVARRLRARYGEDASIQAGALAGRGFAVTLTFPLRRAVATLV